HVKCLIIGSGPAGYTAAIYAARANLYPVVYEGLQPGGQLTTTTEVENFPGYPKGVTGFDMMTDMKKQAIRFGADVRYGNVTEVDFSEHPLKVTIDFEVQLTADTVIIATGASAKYLGLEGEQKYNGLGVSACATCDGFFYRGKTVAVVGGGDTACEEALYLAGLAKKVYMIVRRDVLRASHVMQTRVAEKENIEVLYNTQTLGLFGNDKLEGANLVQGKGTDEEKIYNLPIDGFFLAIGHVPNTQPFASQLHLSEQGYIVTNHPHTSTNIEGVFAAGDVADDFYRQAVIAAGSGAKAAIDAEMYLMEKGLK
ncbi:MAG: thioredoxin-disulfide reductase, partial [Muribaculaceae bacterium]|nr:thioredoxin-disulfide reductase [Muribaculaceae bacterium]